MLISCEPTLPSQEFTCTSNLPAFLPLRFLFSRFCLRCCQDMFPCTTNDSITRNQPEQNKQSTAKHNFRTPTISFIRIPFLTVKNLKPLPNLCNSYRSLRQARKNWNPYSTHAAVFWPELLTFGWWRISTRFCRHIIDKRKHCFHDDNNMVVYMWCGSEQCARNQICESEVRCSVSFEHEFADRPF